MKSISVWHLLSIGLALLIFQPTNAQEVIRLKILSWNIHHAEGVDGQLDLQRIAGVIHAVDPDIVALQEVDQAVLRTHNVDQPAELARLTGLHFVFGANIRLQGGHYGNALLSRWPLANFRNQLLPRVDEGEQRGVLLAEAAIPGLSRPLTLLATHFDHRPADTERLASASAVNKIVAGMGEQPLVLAGDLNAVPDSRPLRVLNDRWRSVNDVTLPTIPAQRPERQIDYILMRPHDRWNVIESRTLDEAVASDHRPVWAVVELRLP